LSETAFFVETEQGFHLRWFTPVNEVKLCGHATLASAHVLFNELGYQHDSVSFQTLSGRLTVTRNGGWLDMDLPAQPPVQRETPLIIVEALASTPESCLANEDWLAIFPRQSSIESLEPNFDILKRLDLRGLTVSAPGADYDFVSRFFAPNYGINEDPVTGSSFSQLVPYWAKRLGKDTLLAKQISKRGGIVKCQLRDDRVIISGQATSYMQARISVPF
jgi:predicted PhzF superfamily epimerase YddE/YHI9